MIQGRLFRRALQLAALLEVELPTVLIYGHLHNVCGEVVFVRKHCGSLFLQPQHAVVRSRRNHERLAVDNLNSTQQITQ